MDITFTSLLNTLLFSTIAIALFSFAVSRTDLFIRRGGTFLSAAIIAVMARLFLPFELFTQQNVFITGDIHDIYLAIAVDTHVIAGREATLLSILITISVCGSFLRLLWLALKYRCTVHMVKMYPVIDDAVTSELISLINSEEGRDRQFEVRCSPVGTTPFIFGLSRPVIVLPKAVCQGPDLYYILRHEMSHCYHGDLWLRFACEILLAIYWWDIPLYLFRKKLIEFQEVHIDQKVTDRLSDLEQMEYLQCLVRTARMQRPPADPGISAFGSQNTLANRSRLILDRCGRQSSPRKQQLTNILLIVNLTLSTMILPNLIVIEPVGPIPDEILETTIGLNASNCYLILNEKEEYDIYYNDQLWSTCTEIFDETIPIYNMKGERIK